MRRLLALLLLLLAAAPAEAALTANMQFMVASGGNSTNGGGFDRTAAGTDMSLYDAKNASGCTVGTGSGQCQSNSANLSTTDAVSNGTTTLTSATASFSSAIVGNLVYFQGGTGAIAATRRRITTFTNATTIVMDASIAASTGMTMNIGGALDKLATAAPLVDTADQTIRWRSPMTEVITSGISLPSPGVSQLRTTIRGCSTFACAVSDQPAIGSQPILQTNAAITAITVNQGGWSFEYITIDCAGGTRGNIGINYSTAGLNISWIGGKISGCAQDAFLSTATANNGTLGVHFAEITGNNVTGTGGTVSCAVNAGLTAVTISFSYIHDNTTCGVRGSQGSFIYRSVIANHTGANVYLGGAAVGGAYGLWNNVIYNAANGACATGAEVTCGNGIYVHNTGTGSDNNRAAPPFVNNLIINNANCGLYAAESLNVQLFPWWDGNSYFGNAGATCVSQVKNYTLSANETLLAANPIPNAGSGDYRSSAPLNTGLPATWPGLSGQTSYPDRGVYEFGGSGGGGGGGGPIGG